MIAGVARFRKRSVPLASRLAVQRLGEPFGRAPALIDEIGADEGDVVLTRLGDAVVDIAVDQDDRDAGFLDLQHLRGQRLRFARREDDDVRFLGDDRIEVGQLLGGVGIRIGGDQGPTEVFLELLLHAGGFGQTPGIVAFGLSETDLIGILLRQRRNSREGVADDSLRRYLSGI